MMPSDRASTSSGFGSAFRRRLRRLLRSPTIELDGFTLVGYRADIPKAMSNRLNGGAYEQPERTAVARYLRPGDRVLDVGACVGVVSLTAARRVGAANVVAFEPNPQAARIAEENFALNRLPVRLMCKAVGPAAGRATIWLGDKDWLGARVGGAGDGGSLIEAEVMAIADAVAELRPTVLILDCEGMEFDVLPACPLDDIRALIVELHLAGQSDAPARLRALLAERGFRLMDSWPSAEGEAVVTEAWLRPD